MPTGRKVPAQTQTQLITWAVLLRRTQEQCQPPPPLLVPSNLKSYSFFKYFYCNIKIRENVKIRRSAQYQGETFFIIVRLPVHRKKEERLVCVLQNIFEMSGYDNNVTCMNQTVSE